jgi:hypothetical protein
MMMKNRFIFFVVFSLLLFIACNNKFKTGSSESLDIDRITEQFAEIRENSLKEIVN